MLSPVAGTIVPIARSLSAIVANAVFGQVTVIVSVSLDVPVVDTCVETLPEPKFGIEIEA
ncbi:hypothetical protein D3C81_2215270 [compost metagenome]